MAFDSSGIRPDFPVLSREFNGRKLVYLDSAATSQKPQSVIDSISNYYSQSNANVHRGVYELSVEASERFESARANIAAFLGASENELVLTKNATEAINLVAYSWGRQNIGEGDVILATQMEHHANLVPWQVLAKEKKASLKFIPLTPEFTLDENAFEALLEGGNVKLAAFSACSNVLGTITPVKELSQKAHRAGATVLVDGAQAVPHQPTDFHGLDVDFLAFSSHKMLGPTGIGGLLGKKTVLESMPPFLAGGDMIREVSFQESTWNEIPFKFEAGTPDAAGTVGLSAAVEYLKKLGMAQVREHEKKLVEYALEALHEIKGLTVYGPEDSTVRAGIAAFTLDGVHPHDLASVLDQEGIAVRAGHHCAMPLHVLLGTPATTRASVYVYTDESDIDALVGGIRKAQALFA